MNLKYTLPPIEFIGGFSEDMIFNLKNEHGVPFDANGLEVDFSIISYADKLGTPVISKYATLVDDGTGAFTILKINFTPNESVDLYGKYIYQITFKNSTNKSVKMPLQGVLTVYRNINPSFVREADG